MPVHTTSSLWCSTITSNSRLFFVTGKGGVGKTVFAEALCHTLKSKNKNVYFATFDEYVDEVQLKDLGISLLKLSPQRSAEKYLNEKLPLSFISGWLTTSPLFKSLLDLLPTLGHLLVLGDLISLLQKDKTLHIIFDSPSTGHLITLFQAPSTFKQLLGSGTVFQDLTKLLSFVENEELIHTFILTTARELVITEALELKKILDQIKIGKNTLLLNQSLKEMFTNESEEIPLLFKSRLKEEDELSSLPSIPYIIAENSLELIKSLGKKLQYDKDKY